MSITREQLLEIKRGLEELAMKDSQFPNADLPLKGNEKIPILQDAINKLAPVSALGGGGGGADVYVTSSDHSINPSEDIPQLGTKVIDVSVNSNLSVEDTHGNTVYLIFSDEDNSLELPCSRNIASILYNDKEGRVFTVHIIAKFTIASENDIQIKVSGDVEDSDYYELHLYRDPATESRIGNIIGTFTLRSKYQASNNTNHAVFSQTLTDKNTLNRTVWDSYFISHNFTEYITMEGNLSSNETSLGCRHREGWLLPDADLSSFLEDLFCIRCSLDWEYFDYVDVLLQYTQSAMYFMDLEEFPVLEDFIDECSEPLDHIYSDVLEEINYEESEGWTSFLGDYVDFDLTSYIGYVSSSDIALISILAPSIFSMDYGFYSDYYESDVSIITYNPSELSALCTKKYGIKINDFQPVTFNGIHAPTFVDEIVEDDFSYNRPNYFQLVLEHNNGIIKYLMNNIDDFLGYVAIHIYPGLNTFQEESIPILHRRELFQSSIFKEVKDSSNNFSAYFDRLNEVKCNPLNVLRLTYQNLYDLITQEVTFNLWLGGNNNEGGGTVVTRSVIPSDDSNLTPNFDPELAMSALLQGPYLMDTILVKKLILSWYLESFWSALNSASNGTFIFNGETYTIDIPELYPEDSDPLNPGPIKSKAIDEEYFSTSTEYYFARSFKYKDSFEQVRNTIARINKTFTKDVTDFMVGVTNNMEMFYRTGSIFIKGTDGKYYEILQGNPFDWGYWFSESGITEILSGSADFPIGPGGKEISRSTTKVVRDSDESEDENEEEEEYVNPINERFRHIYGVWESMSGDVGFLGKEVKIGYIGDTLSEDEYYLGLWADILPAVIQEIYSNYDDYNNPDNPDNPDVPINSNKQNLK